MEASTAPLIKNEKAFMASLEMKERPYRKARAAGVLGDVAVTAERGLYYKSPKALRSDPEELAEKVVEFAAASVKTGEYENVRAGKVERVLSENWGLDKGAVSEVIAASRLIFLQVVA